jgi:hypothetical protein
MAAVNIRGSVVRIVGGLSVLAALALSSGVAAAGNPVKVGFVECDSGQCVTTTRTTAVAGVQNIGGLRPGGKRGPRLLDESTQAPQATRGNAGGHLSPHLEP